MRHFESLRLHPQRRRARTAWLRAQSERKVHYSDIPGAKNTGINSINNEGDIAGGYATGDVTADLLSGGDPRYRRT